MERCSYQPCLLSRCTSRLLYIAKKSLATRMKILDILDLVKLDKAALVEKPEIDMVVELVVYVVTAALLCYLWMANKLTLWTREA